MTTHTPGPYYMQWDTLDENGCEGPTPHYYVTAQGVGMIAEVCGPDCSDDQNEANAEYIVHALQAHDALVKACEAAHAVLQAVDSEGRSIEHVAATWTIRDALALARTDLDGGN